MERKTVQRDVLLNVIVKAGHITIKDILENAKSCFPSMSIGTIYRNLSVLENEGLIRRIPTIYKEDVYETTDYPVHDHFICKVIFQELCSLFFVLQQDFRLILFQYNMPHTNQDQY